MLGNTNNSSANNSSVNLLHGSESNDTNCGFTDGPAEVYITIHVVTLVVSLVENILLIAAYVRMKEIIMLPIANMAASDLLTALVLMPRLIKSEFTGSNAFLIHGDFGTFLCKMSVFLSDISLSVSTQSLVFIAIERFLAIAYPIFYRKVITVKRRCLFVALTWVISMGIHSPYFYAFRLSANHICEMNWEPAFDNESTRPRYAVFIFVTVLFLPLLTISLLYCIFCVKVRRDNMASSRSERAALRHQERSKKLQRMGIATVSAFLICWLLYIVMNVYRELSSDTDYKCSKGFKILDRISRVLASCYSAVNPCICFIFVQSFSRQLRALCRLTVCCKGS